MIRRFPWKWTLALSALWFMCHINEIQCANGDKPELSAPMPTVNAPLLKSYLPASMQVMANLMHQMMYDRPKQDMPMTMTASTMTTTTTSTTTTTPRTKATTSSKPVGAAADHLHVEFTTQSHGPAIFAPLVPPSPDDSLLAQPYLTPYDQEQPLLTDDINPDQPYLPLENKQNPLYWSAIARSGIEEIGENTKGLPDISSLPLDYENNFKGNPLEFEQSELSDENLQYVSKDVGDILRRTRDRDINEKWSEASSFQSLEELFDDNGDRAEVSDWLRLRKAPPKASLIRMMLLYDLLSKDAKKQKLDRYRGYKKEMIQELNETSTGTSIDQLTAMLERMLARGDCTYDFANKQAKSLVIELKNPKSDLANEIRYLDPLRFIDL